jgi:hypothetical protein
VLDTSGIIKTQEKSPSTSEIGEQRRAPNLPLRQFFLNLTRKVILNPHGMSNLKITTLYISTLASIKTQVQT